MRILQLACLMAIALLSAAVPVPGIDARPHAYDFRDYVANSAYAKYVKPAAAYTPAHADGAAKGGARSNYVTTIREDARIRALDNKIKALREQRQQQHHRIDVIGRQYQSMQIKETRGEEEKRRGQANSKSFGADEGLLNTRVDGEMFPSVEGPSTSSNLRKGWTVRPRVDERGE